MIEKLFKGQKAESYRSTSIDNFFTRQDNTNKRGFKLISQDKQLRKQN